MRPVGSLARGSNIMALLSCRDPAGAPFQTSSSSRPSKLSRGDVTGLLDTGAQVLLGHLSGAGFELGFDFGIGGSFGGLLDGPHVGGGEQG